MELLFEGRTNLGGMSGSLRFIQHQPEIHPEPVLRPDATGDGKRVSLYGSVLRDGGKLRMWYYAVPRGQGERVDAAFVAHAESEDGLTWTKPALGLVEPDLGPNNLTNLGLHSATVFMDPDSPATHRFRATGCGKKGYAGSHPNISLTGYYTAHSADGLRWDMDMPEPRWASSDVITSIYHPGRRSGVVALKYTPRWMRMARRSIHTAEFRNGAYTDTVTALYPDEFDDLCAQNRGFHSCDYYGMGMMPAGQAVVGFLWKYWHELPYTRGFGNGAQALYGRSDVALVYQPEPGGRWFHVPGRPLFLDRTALPWTAGWINTASNVIEVGDEQRLYFSGCTFPHGYGLDESWKPIPSADLAQEQTGIFFARWPKWRLFGFEALPEGTLKIQLGKIEKPSEVYLNYEVIRPHGFVRAGFVGDGFEERRPEDSAALTGSSTGARLAWKTGTVIPASPNARLSLQLQAARVYAYEVRPAG
jgi:hypothetical protein